MRTQLKLNNLPNIISVELEELKSMICNKRIGPLDEVNDNILTNNEWITANNLRIFHRLCPDKHEKGALLIKQLSEEETSKERSRIAKEEYEMRRINEKILRSNDSRLKRIIYPIIYIAKKCFIALCSVHKTDLIEKLTLEKTKEIIFAGIFADITKNKIETPLSNKISQERWEIFLENYNNDCEIWTYQDFCGLGIAIKSNNRIIKKIELIKT